MIDVDLELLPCFGQKAGEKDITFFGKSIEEIEATRLFNVEADAPLASIGLLPHEVEPALGD